MTLRPVLEAVMMMGVMVVAAVAMADAEEEVEAMEEEAAADGDNLPAIRPGIKGKIWKVLSESAWHQGYNWEGIIGAFSRMKHDSEALDWLLSFNYYTKRTNALYYEA